MTKKSDYNHSSHHANDRTNHRSFLKFQIPNSAKFRENVKFLLQRTNSVARLKIPRPHII